MARGDAHRQRDPGVATLPLPRLTRRGAPLVGRVATQPVDTGAGRQARPHRVVAKTYPSVVAAK